jgi:hypothetical protein
MVVVPSLTTNVLNDGVGDPAVMFGVTVTCVVAPIVVAEPLRVPDTPVWVVMDCELDAVDVPTLFCENTLKRYVVLSDNDESEYVVDVVLAMLIESLNILYCVMAEPPSDGADHERSACTFDTAVADRSVIAAGTVGVVIELVLLIGLVPCVDTAFNEYTYVPELGTVSV